MQPSSQVVVVGCRLEFSLSFSYKLWHSTAIFQQQSNLCYCGRHPRRSLFPLCFIHTLKVIKKNQKTKNHQTTAVFYLMLSFPLTISNERDQTAHQTMPHHTDMFKSQKPNFDFTRFSKLFTVPPASVMYFFP